jgi:hypothetical protein
VGIATQSLALRLNEQAAAPSHPRGSQSKLLPG